MRDSAQGLSLAPREGRADITTLVIRDADAFLERVLGRDPDAHAVMDTAGTRDGLPEHPHFSRRVRVG